MTTCFLEYDIWSPQCTGPLQYTPIVSFQYDNIRFLLAWQNVVPFCMTDSGSFVVCYFNTQLVIYNYTALPVILTQLYNQLHVSYSDTYLAMCIYISVTVILTQLYLELYTSPIFTLTQLYLAWELQQHTCLIIWSC